MLFEIILVIIHLEPYLFLFSISLDVFFFLQVLIFQDSPKYQQQFLMFTLIQNGLKDTCVEFLLG